MNTTEIQRLAAMAYALRPDWSPQSVRSHLESDHGHKAYKDVAIALAWIATDPETSTPKRLAFNGPWWRAAMTDETRTPQPPARQRDPNHVPADPSLQAQRAQEARNRIRAARAATGVPDDVA